MGFGVKMVAANLLTKLSYIKDGCALSFSNANRECHRECKYDAQCQMGLQVNSTHISTLPTEGIMKGLQEFIAGCTEEPPPCYQGRANTQPPPSQSVEKPRHRPSTELRSPYRAAEVEQTPSHRLATAPRNRATDQAPRVELELSSC